MVSLISVLTAPSNHPLRWCLIAALTLFHSLGSLSADDNALDEEGCDHALRIFTASSLVPVFDALKRSDPALLPCDITVVPGPSGTLARQILAGAPADIFISANTGWVDRVVHRATSASTAIVRNSLILTSHHCPTDWSAETIRQITETTPIILGDPKLAPLGAYAWQALSKLLGAETLDSLPTAFAASARQARALAARTDAAAVLYKSDLISLPATLCSADVPEDMHADILYTAVPLGQNRYATGTFMTVLTGPDMAALWHSYGFSPLSQIGSNSGKSFDFETSHFDTK